MQIHTIFVVIPFSLTVHYWSVYVGSPVQFWWCGRYTCPYRKQNFLAVEKRKKPLAARVWGLNCLACPMGSGYDRRVQVHTSVRKKVVLALGQRGLT